MITCLTKGFQLIYVNKSATLAAIALLTAALPGSMANGQSSAPPDLGKQPTLYAVGYAHLDTEWRWEYPQVINEYLRKTMEDNFRLLDKYPHYVFNFSGANRYRLMKEYHPADFARVKDYVRQGRWYPAGSSMEEGDVNAPSAEAIIRQILYGNDWFRKEFGVASAEYMLPDCFGFPSSLPTILAHSGVRGFSTQKLTWGSGSYVGGPQSVETTPAGTPFDVGVWVGPDGSKVLAALNPGSYGSRITTDLSVPFEPVAPSATIVEHRAKLQELQTKRQALQKSGKQMDPADQQDMASLRSQLTALESEQKRNENQRFQEDWAARVLANGKATGVYADYRYYGTGDIGGAPDEGSVSRLEALVTKSTASFPLPGQSAGRGAPQPLSAPVVVGKGPVDVISAKADQMFLDITPAEAAALPRYTGELELTNHSAGSLTSQAYQKRWIRQQELLADAAEKASIAAEWLGGRTYPLARLNDAWTLTMGAHFHDLAAGTATPKSYEFAWNDDVIAMNQFAGVLASATDAVASGLDTQTKGTPIVVFNPLNIGRQDLVEASFELPAGSGNSVRVTGPNGKTVPAQFADGKVTFLADASSVGYTVYDVQAISAPAPSSTLRVTESELENDYYRVRVDAAGDVASIYDKTVGRELLSAPARLAISYDNPSQWPAWNMDWEQEQATPKAYVSGPATIRIIERGPARVALEISRDTAGSHFVQTISLAAGDAGKRVEYRNSIDWNTRESNLKATFPLTASNELATYNWDVGTIQRPTAEPNKFEVPSHQWIDLTDMSGAYGATILTDCKNGSDKPNDNTIRLTLLRTPGTRGGYHDEATQDLGHHDFVYGISGHRGDWREGQTDWQAERVNAPLFAFVAKKHAGKLGRNFSLLHVSSPRVRVLALKKAERSDETIIRLVEMSGKPAPIVHVTFGGAVVTAREVNGQEQPVGTATITNGQLATSLTAYQPRTFAIRLAPAFTKVAAVKSQAVALNYDVATASNAGERTVGGFDGNGNALPAEMLPTHITFANVNFQLAKAGMNLPNAILAKGQTIKLPRTPANRIYILAASTDGDQTATFEVGATKVTRNIQRWGGFIGQWDDRQWSSTDTTHDNYGEMTGIKPGFIKRADLAWYSSHHQDKDGAMVPYSYSYLFAYTIDLPPSTTTIKLPENSKIRILAMSVAEEDTGTRPAHPLYDVLPPPSARVADESTTTSQATQGVSR